MSSDRSIALYEVTRGRVPYKRRAEIDNRMQIKMAEKAFSNVSPMTVYAINENAKESSDSHNGCLSKLSWSKYSSSSSPASSSFQYLTLRSLHAPTKDATSTAIKQEAVANRARASKCLQLRQYHSVKE